MLRVVQVFTFLTIFISIYGAGNAYIIWRTNQLLGFKFSKITFILIVISTASFILGALIDRFAHNIFTRIFYGITASWMGISLFLLTGLLIFEIINLFHKIPPKPSIYTILIAVIITSAYAIFNAFSLKTKNIIVPIKNLESELNIVQLSDLHVGTINNGNFITKVVKNVNKLEPEIVVITGDLVDGSGPLRQETYEILNKIKAPVYFVMGNHETYEDMDEVLKIMQNLDLKVLMNENIEINGIQLIGLNFSESKKEIEKNLKNISIEKDKPSILLAHNPNVFKAAIEKGIDLQLSGHTHNGQIVPFNFLVKLVYPQIQGLYKKQNTQLYVSPGTGTWGPFMRLGSKNEITFLKLTPAI